MRVGATRLNVKYPIWDPMDIEYYPRVSHPPDLRSQPTAKLKYLYFSTLPEMMLKSMYLNLWQTRAKPGAALQTPPSLMN